MFLAVEHKSDMRLHGKPAVFEIVRGKLKLIRGGNWLPETWLEEKLSKRPKIGMEHFARAAEGEAITRLLIEVLPTDANYLEAWRQEFEREGFCAEIVDEKRAKLWESLRASGIDSKVQDQAIFGINRLSDDDISKIQKELGNLPN